MCTTKKYRIFAFFVTFAIFFGMIPAGSVIVFAAEKVATPVISVNIEHIMSGGSSAQGRVLITSSTPGAVIYYTIDGSTPTQLSTEWRYIFDATMMFVEGGAGTSMYTNVSVIKAIAVKSGMETSEVAEYIFSASGNSGATAETAAKNVEEYINKMTPGDRISTAAIDRLILFAEEEILKAAAKKTNDSLIELNISVLNDLQTQAVLAKNLIENVFGKYNIDIIRNIRAGVRLETSQTKRVIVSVNSSLTDMTANNIEINTPNYSVSIPQNTVLTDVSSGSLVITVEAEEAANVLSKAFAGLNPDSYLKLYAAAAKQGQYIITLSKDLKEYTKFSFNPVQGDVNYQAVQQQSDGTYIGGKYNPVTQKIEVRIKRSGTYTVKENRKNFNDTANKSTEMRNAIGILASKGIINGTSAATFNPDGEINRAEIAALIVRLISALDRNADGKFDDVQKGTWIFEAAGSAKAAGIMNGTSATTFEPYAKIKKEQIIAIAARALRKEMNYKTPGNPESELKRFTDRNLLPSWGTDDFALASVRGLIAERTDGKFNPTATMTRGEVAIIIYKLYDLIW